uniref:Uncharacterized protein n=1 Tax=Macaca nemestrina TaxID=9545 RepID=A0A2K6CCJ6_MACNE
CTHDDGGPTLHSPARPGPTTSRPAGAARRRAAGRAGGGGGDRVVKRGPMNALPWVLVRGAAAQDLAQGRTPRCTTREISKRLGGGVEGHVRSREAGRQDASQEGQVYSLAGGLLAPPQAAAARPLPWRAGPVGRRPVASAWTKPGGGGRGGYAHVNGWPNGRLPRLGAGGRRPAAADDAGAAAGLRQHPARAGGTLPRANPPRTRIRQPPCTRYPAQPAAMHRLRRSGGRLPISQLAGATMSGRRPSGYGGLPYGARAAAAAAAAGGAPELGACWRGGAAAAASSGPPWAAGLSWVKSEPSGSPPQPALAGLPCPGDLREMISMYLPAGEGGDPAAAAAAAAQSRLHSLPQHYQGAGAGVNGTVPLTHI